MEELPGRNSGDRPAFVDGVEFSIAVFPTFYIPSLFDIEVIFFLPWAIVFRQLKIFGLIEMIVFIVVLLIGYVYAWKKGALEWE